MPARRTKRDRIIDAALALAGERRWDEVTFTAIASRAGVSLADLRREFAGRPAILFAFFDQVDVEMLEGVDGEGEAESARDRIFDLLMRRFDALALHKPALKRLAAGLMREPATGLALAARQARRMRWVLDAAGVSTRGIAGRIRVQGLMAAHARVFGIWLNEDDPGLPRTMAALDRMLGDGERWLAAIAAPIGLADACLDVAADIVGRRRVVRSQRSSAAGNDAAVSEG